ncbi:hypothetical protein D1007_26573 [Hordeum vulgare]|nr:hypothetical protein D1007_26573 [Hordeum vulgare]
MRDNISQLHALYQARKEKLDSRVAFVGAAEDAFEKRFEETWAHFTEAHQELKVEQKKLRVERDELLPKPSDIQKEEEEARRHISDEDARLNVLQISLKSHEDEVADREKALDGRLHAKYEEVERLVVWHTQELSDHRKNALATEASKHAGELQEFVDSLQVRAWIPNKSKVGVKVVLKTSIYSNKRNVAYRTIQSTDPRTKAGGIELDAEFALVRIDQPVLDSKELVREVPDCKKIGEAFS